MNLCVDVNAAATAVDNDCVIESLPIDIFEHQTERQNNDCSNIESVNRLNRNSMRPQAPREVGDRITDEWPGLCTGQLSNQKRRW